MSIKSDRINDAGDKVASKVATLVETAADIAEKAFRSAMDKSELPVSNTSNKLTSTVRKTNKLVHKHARTIGIGAIIGGVLTLIGTIILFGRRARNYRR